MEFVVPEYTQSGAGKDSNRYKCFVKIGISLAVVSVLLVMWCYREQIIDWFQFCGEHIGESFKTSCDYCTKPRIAGVPGINNPFSNNSLLSDYTGLYSLTEPNHLELS